MSNTSHNILVRTAFAVVLVAVAGSAWAGNVVKGPGPAGPEGPVGAGNRGTPVQLNFDAKTCNAEDRVALTEAFTIAKERVAAGLQVVTRNPNDPRLTRWFGDAPRERIAEVLQSVARKLETAGSFTIACRTAYCEQRQPMAYTISSNALVGFCTGFFRSALIGEDSRVGTVVHEISHLAANTSDHVYGRPNASTLGAKAPNRAADNADNFEYFIETLAE